MPTTCRNARWPSPGRWPGRDAAPSSNRGTPAPSTTSMRPSRRSEGGAMFLEIAEIEVRAGEENAFEEGVRTAVPLFLRARGCHGVDLQRTVEAPSRYKLIVTWETVDDHMVHFRTSRSDKRRVGKGRCR